MRRALAPRFISTFASASALMLGLSGCTALFGIDSDGNGPEAVGPESDLPPRTLPEREPASGEPETGEPETGEPGVGEPGVGEPETGEPETPNPEAHCPPDVALLPIEDLAQDFEATIYPLMLREDGGCVQCHAAGSGRQMAMGTTGVDTFHRLRIGGFLTFTSGSMLDRIDRDSMPPEGPFWTDAEKTSLTDFVCQVATYEAEHGGALDEIFPPALLEPYDGPAPTEYDNTFLTYLQLKGRIATQFGDNWVRDGTDRFEENIALFGGVNFDTAFVPARGATPEFLIGTEVMASDVCQAAAQAGTGPFVGLDLTGPIRDASPEAHTFYAASDYLSLAGNGSLRDPPWTVGGNSPPYLNVNSNGGGRIVFNAPDAGQYEVSVSAEGREAGPDLPRLELRATGNDPVLRDVPGGGFRTYTATFTVDAPGEVTFDAMFTNDFYDPENGLDRNMRIGPMDIRGPIEGTTGGADGARDATLQNLSDLFSRILLRPPVRSTVAEDDELEPLYALLRDLESFDGNLNAAWAGACEGLLMHPDFLFTRPPRFDEAPESERERMLLIKTAFDLVDRPPTATELADYDLGEVTRDELIDRWLDSDAFRDAYYHRARVLLETDGTVDGDEPARLLTYAFLNDRPIRDVLTAEYSVNEAFEAVERPPEHGATGLLTMKGYIRGKPGLPHYNYSARVLAGFLGYVFEVPPEAFEARDTATAASTVDPESLCYSCHRVLTPLAYQRLAWDDEGNYRTVDEQGVAIDDSDHDLVEGYPYAGDGLEAFAAQAVRKEGYVRRMANVEFSMVFGRPMRHDTDERDIYRDLWDVAQQGEGTFRDLLKTTLNHEAYVRPVGSRGEGGQ